MDNKLNTELSGWHELGVRMNQYDGSEIREAAKISHELMWAGLDRNAWYCCLLVRLGGWLVSLGNHLKIRYSAQPAHRMQ